MSCCHAREPPRLSNHNNPKCCFHSYVSEYIFIFFSIPSSSRWPGRRRMHRQETAKTNGKYMLLKLDKRHQWWNFTFFKNHTRQILFLFSGDSYVCMNDLFSLSHCNVQTIGRTFLSFHRSQSRILY